MNFWNKLRGSKPDRAQVASVISNLRPDFDDEGILYPIVTDREILRATASERAGLAYLHQLEEEGLITPLVEKWLLPWEQVYEVLRSPVHEGSTALLGLPPMRPLRPVLSSSGALSDEGFKVSIASWETAEGVPIRTAPPRQGAVFTLDRAQYMMPEAVWKLLRALQQLHRNQKATPGEKTNQLGWAAVRKLAKRAYGRLS